MPGNPDCCQHIKVNGVQCGSPAMRRNPFCFFHKRLHDDRIRLATENARARRAAGTLPIPAFEDANSIQIALSEVVHLLFCQQIEHKTASLLLYALQTATANLHRTRDLHSGTNGACKENVRRTIPNSGRKKRPEDA